MGSKERLMRGLIRIQGFFREPIIEKKPEFVLSDEAKNSLRELVLRGNPRGSESWFLGAGKGRFVEKVYTPKEFSDGSGFRYIRKGVIETSLGFAERIALFEEIRSLGGGKDNILFLGHLHPSGTVDVNGKSIEIPPSERLLRPSAYDLKELKDEIEEGVLCHAIAANTENGPCVRIYSLKPLLGRPNRKKLPYATINLSS